MVLRLLWIYNSYGSNGKALGGSTGQQRGGFFCGGPRGFFYGSTRVTFYGSVRFSGITGGVQDFGVELKY